MVPENVCTICLEKFQTKYGKSIATVPLFSYWNSSKRVFNCFVWKTCHSCELLPQLIVVVIQDSEDGKRSVCKECARKIVNFYRKFTELREAWRVVRHLTRCREVLHQLLRQPVLGVEFLFEASDLATGVTPKEKWQKQPLWRAQWRPHCLVMDVKEDIMSYYKSLRSQNHMNRIFSRSLGLCIQTSKICCQLQVQDWYNYGDKECAVEVLLDSGLQETFLRTFSMTLS